MDFVLQEEPINYTLKVSRNKQFWLSKIYFSQIRHKNSKNMYHFEKNDKVHLSNHIYMRSESEYIYTHNRHTHKGNELDALAMATKAFLSVVCFD